VSEWILKGISAHIQCHSRWMLWKIQESRQIKHTGNEQIKYDPEQANNANCSKTKLYPSSVAFYDTRPGNEVSLFYNAPDSGPHGALMCHSINIRERIGPRFADMPGQCGDRSCTRVGLLWH